MIQSLCRSGKVVRAVRRGSAQILCVERGHVSALEYLRQQAEADALAAEGILTISAESGTALTEEC